MISSTSPRSRSRGPRRLGGHEHVAMSGSSVSQVAEVGVHSKVRASARPAGRRSGRDAVVDAEVEVSQSSVKAAEARNGSCWMPPPSSTSGWPLIARRPARRRTRPRTRTPRAQAGGRGSSSARAMPRPPRRSGRSSRRFSGPFGGSCPCRPRSGRPRSQVTPVSGRARRPSARIRPIAASSRPCTPPCSGALEAGR